MMVLQPTEPKGSTNNSSSSSSSSSKSSGSSSVAAASNNNNNNNNNMNNRLLRRRRSKGTITGRFSSGEGSAETDTDVKNNLKSGSSGAGGSSNNNNNTATATAATNSQRVVVEKPSHASQIVLLCVQNALRMSPQMHLCPPGRARRELQAVLRQEPRLSPEESNVFNYTQHSTDPNKDYDDDNEDASSADEDDLLGPHDSTAVPPTEPLYLPAGTDPTTTKLPFNRRKIRYFDNITPADSNVARAFCQQQLRRGHQRHAQALTHHLQQVQRQERIRLGKSVPPEEPAPVPDTLLATTGFSPLEQPMTPPLSAALLLESLQVNRKESLEGMAKCYDGIVAAGMALLEADSQTEILSALTPLLITSLTETSGQAILQLAQLRRMCGTARYQRRFVQRVAPLWIRPPTVWSLRHQQDMEAILAAAEWILDCADTQIFTKGWYERGQLILADSKRAKTLDSAAQQLRTLSQAGNLGFGASSSSSSSHHHHQQQHWLTDTKTTKPLADWEVGAVVRHIKVSITCALKTDWSKVTPQADVPRPFRRNYKRESPKAPRSPTRVLRTTTAPQSPPTIPTETMENVFGPAFDRPSSPPPPELSPRPFASLTPPKSPKSPVLRENLPQPPLSPKRNTKTTMTVKDTVGSNVAAASPLSPSASSVGTNASAEMVAYRPTPTTPSATTSNNYRLLTSTAAERKRTVAACRALRAQIQRFEDAFIQLHGRPPKGNAERAPLSTTYAQYREWKRAIRADAACRIQALVRGAQTRSRLLRSGLVSSRIILKRPGRPGSVAANIMNQISIPVDIGTDAGGGESPTTSSSSASYPALAPQWASTVVRRRSEDFNSPGRRAFQATSPTADLSNLSLEELQSRKRELKRQLKQYDMNFARRHGRMPVKAEKEPIRHLYENYNALKSQISLAEGNPQNRSTRSDDPSSDTSLPDEQHPQQQQQPPPRRSSRMDLQALKAEKSQLHQMLRSYERDFYEEHRRQVSSFSDIRPVASQYRRYKEIKRAIAALQQQQQSTTT